MENVRTAADDDELYDALIKAEEDVRKANNRK